MARTITLALLALLLSAATASAEDAAPTALPAPPGSEAEPNQTLETATPIAAGERIRATRPAGDVDHYRFTAQQGDRVFAAVITIGSQSGNTDSRLAVLGPDGAVLESDNDNGTLTDTSSTIAGTTIPATGTYYLRVDAPGNTIELLPYDLLLAVHTGDPVPEVEPNNGPDDRHVLAGDSLVSGTKESGPADLYELTLAAGDTVFLSLDLDPERDGQSINGRLSFGTQERLVTVNDGGVTDEIPSEVYAGTVDSAGPHLIMIDSTAAAESGSYQLSVTVIRAVERSCRTYTLTPSPGDIPDVGAATFPIDVPDAATIDHAALRLDITHPFMQDLDATLEGPAGNRISLFDDIGSGTVGNSSTRMWTLFDDNAGTPPVYPWLKGLGLQPERPGRLSWFEGQQAAGTWKLTVRDDANDDVGTLARADLILCARPEEGPVDTVFSAGFESGDDGFTHSGDADEWEHGTPATGATDGLAELTRCAQGTRCFTTDLDGTYDANSRQDLVSPPISLEGRTGTIHASWETWYQLENAHFDHFAVSVEEDGGANARPLFTWTGSDMWVAHGNPGVGIPLAAGWGRHRADISDYAGKTIRLRFHLDSDDTVQRRGVAIDDVRVYQPASAPEPAPPAPHDGGDTQPAGAAPTPSAAAEPAISDLRLASRCVRRTTAGRVKVPMTMRLAQPGAIRVSIDRAVGSKGRRSCPRANPVRERNTRFRRVQTVRPAGTDAVAAALTRRVTLDLRLRPGLYRLGVRVQLEDGRLSAPARRFLRVVG